MKIAKMEFKRSQILNGQFNMKKYEYIKLLYEVFIVYVTLCKDVCQKCLGFFFFHFLNYRSHFYNENVVRFGKILSHSIKHFLSEFLPAFILAT